MNKDNSIGSDVKQTPDKIEEEQPSAAKSAEIDQRLSRNAQRILEIIIKGMPRLAKSLKIKGDRERIAHDVDIPGIEKYSAMIIASYVIIKGDKERIIYFATLQPALHQRLQQILTSNAELLKRLTTETRSIQFACPEIGKGFHFKLRKSGFFSKETFLEEFNLR